MQLKEATFLRHRVTMNLSNPFLFFGQFAAQKNVYTYARGTQQWYLYAAVKPFTVGWTFFSFFFLSLHFPSESTSILADYKYEYRIRIDHRFLHRWFTGRPVQQRWSYEYFSTIRFRQPASHRPFALLHHDLRLFRIIRHKFWHCCSIRKLQFYA